MAPEGAPRPRCAGPTRTGSADPERTGRSQLRAPRPSRSTSWRSGLILLAACTLVGAGCNRDRFSEPLTLGGEQVSASTLNLGLKTFRRYCSGCHGIKGDGNSPTASSMAPPPRNLTLGQFKFKSVPDDRLPTDADVLHTLRSGLKGTHMPAWNRLPDAELQAVVQYIKTLSPRWRTERPGKPLRIKADPWRDRRQAAIDRGRDVYHGRAACWECHPAYIPRAALRSIVEKLADRAGKTDGANPGSLDLRSEVHRSRSVETTYGALNPPDFLKETLRAGRTDADLYRTIAAGIGGTPMPSWYRQLSVRDLWATVHYVRHLVRLKGTPRARRLRESLRRQP